MAHQSPIFGMLWSFLSFEFSSKALDFGVLVGISGLLRVQGVRCPCLGQQILAVKRFGASVAHLPRVRASRLTAVRVMGYLFRDAGCGCGVRAFDAF